MRMATLKMIFIWVFWTILVSIAVAESSVSATFPNPNLALRIDHPRGKATESYVHKLASNVILVNKTGVITLRLDCWAPYPIDLKFHGHLTNQETTVKTFRKDHGTKENPKSLFIINATMETYEQITGNYTCVSIEHPSRFSSYYIFVSPTLPGVLLTRGQKIIMQMKANDAKVLFPCAVSHPDVNVQFFKNENQIIPSTDLFYDPKIGFSMVVQRGDTSVFGNYSCRTELSPKDRVNFTLIPPKKFKVNPEINHIRLPPNGQLNISCRATDNFIMIYQPMTLPVIQNEVKLVDDLNLTYQSYYKFKSAFITASLEPDAAGFVDCNWKSSNRTFARWSFSVSHKEIKKPGQLETSRLSTACPNASHIIAYECSNPVECRINSCLRQDPTCQSDGRVCLRGTNCMQNGLIQCASEIASVVEIFFTGFPTSSQPNKTNRYVEWKHASNEELLLLNEVWPQYHYRKQDAYNVMRFACQGSNFVFSSGFKWIIHFHDGTQITSTSSKDNIDEDMNVTVNNSWREKKSNLESMLTISLGKSAKKTISIVECQAPVWDSWQWISRKIPVDVTRSFRNENVFKNWASSTYLSTAAVLKYCLIYIYVYSLLVL